MPTITTQYPMYTSAVNPLGTGPDLHDCGTYINLASFYKTLVYIIAPVIIGTRLNALFRATTRSMHAPFLGFLNILLVNLPHFLAYALAMATGVIIGDEEGEVTAPFITIVFRYFIVSLTPHIILSRSFYLFNDFLKMNGSLKDFGLVAGNILSIAALAAGLCMFGEAFYDSCGYMGCRPGCKDTRWEDQTAGA